VQLKHVGASKTKVEETRVKGAPGSGFPQESSNAGWLRRRIPPCVLYNLRKVGAKTKEVKGDSSHVSSGASIFPPREKAQTKAGHNFLCLRTTIIIKDFIRRIYPQDAQSNIFGYYDICSSTQ
jgi:hypothetical protein